MEDIFKKIVLDFNEQVKKYRKNPNKQETCELFFKKIAPHWPLEKGSVDKKRLAWNTFPTAPHTIQSLMAFLIQTAGVFRTKDKNTKIHILDNPYCTPLFWSDVKRYYTFFSFSNSESVKNRTHFVKDVLSRNCCIALCLEDTFFKLRSGVNQELVGFEYFLEDLVNANNSLVVFSMQNFMDAEEEKLQAHNYSISFKINRDVSKISVQQAMEPKAHLIQSAQFIEPQKTGCFDRLVDLLGMGQNFISSVEANYKKIRTCN